MSEMKNLTGRALVLARRKAMSTGGKTAVGGTSQAAAQAAERKPKKQARQAQAKVKSSTPSPAASPARSKVRSKVVVEDASKLKSLARRKALSVRGKSADSSKDRTRDANMIRRSKQVKSDVEEVKSTDTKNSKGCGCGCNGKPKAERCSSATTARRKTKSKSKKRNDIPMSTSKAASLARRKALSSRGKAGINKGGMTQAQTARAANPDLSSRELAAVVRTQRSKSGGAGQKTATRPTGKVRKASDTGAARDASWKVGASETVRGQTVTGTMVGQDKDVTGNDAGTCRDVTGTEYMGADVFRDLCQSEPKKTPSRGGKTETLSGNTVTGNRVGRSTSVTGDEPGTCKNVTGTEYLSGEQMEAFCGKKSEVQPLSLVHGQTDKGKVVTGDNVVSNMNVTGGEAGSGRQLTGAQYVQPVDREAPAKVAKSQTLQGGSVTGIYVGRSSKMTGDEPGSCSSVTGDEYLGQEHFTNFCESTPKPQDRKVGMETTDSGRSVTGTMTSRSKYVTGNEPGSCNSVTGTPYAGLEQASKFCDAKAVSSIAARTRVVPARANMTGIQPAVGGVMTGDQKGQCEAVSGTPYVGSEQQAKACGTEAPAEVDSGDFTVSSPVHAAAPVEKTGGVTGSSSYQGNITGAFSKANDKVSGTDEVRFGGRNIEKASKSIEEVSGRAKSRVSGEGMDPTSKITGNDWDSGERVTGQGSSAKVRNITRKGNDMKTSVMNSAAATNREVEKEVAQPQPISRVTGASGNYENGSLITFSGGARG